MAKKASPGDWGEFIGEKGNLFGGEYVWLSLSKPLQDFSAVSPAELVPLAGGRCGHQVTKYSCAY
jgi:hypothetical protein